MRNQNSFFIIFCLSLTVAFMALYAVFAGYFDGRQQYELRLSKLQKQVEKEKFNSTLLSHQLKDFQQSVAQVLPNSKTLQAKYELRNLASTVRRPASEDSLDLSSVLYEKGKKFFNNQNYDQAIKEFYGLIEKYPLSAHSVEARFFIAESYFLKKDFQASLGEIDTMVTHYPQHDLTGFILLRMGQISEYNNQTSEASEIYKMVLQNFKNEDLKNQAKKLAQGAVF